MRRYALEAAQNTRGGAPAGLSGLQYTGPEDDPDRTARTQLLAESLDEIRVLKESGRLPAEVDPACLLVMLMAAAMATTTLPQVIEVFAASIRDPLNSSNPSLIRWPSWAG